MNKFLLILIIIALYFLFKNKKENFSSIFDEECADNSNIPEYNSWDSPPQDAVCVQDESDFYTPDDGPNSCTYQRELDGFPLYQSSMGTPGTTTTYFKIYSKDGTKKTCDKDFTIVKRKGKGKACLTIMKDRINSLPITKKVDCSHNNYCYYYNKPSSSNFITDGENFLLGGNCSKSLRGMTGHQGFINKDIKTTLIEARTRYDEFTSQNESYIRKPEYITSPIELKITGDPVNPKNVITAWTSVPRTISFPSWATTGSSAVPHNETVVWYDSTNKYTFTIKNYNGDLYFGSQYISGNWIDTLKKQAENVNYTKPVYVYGENWPYSIFQNKKCKDACLPFEYPERSDSMYWRTDSKGNRIFQKLIYDGNLKLYNDSFNNLPTCQADCDTRYPL